MKRTLLISLLTLAAFSMYAQSANQPAGNGAVCKKFQNMPADATPVWPKGAYTPLEDPSCAPCYEYKSKHTGVMIMECPYLQFPAEHNGASAANSPEPVTPAQINTDRTDRSIAMQAQNTYTGNYPVCKRDPDMPAGARPVWPKGAYTPLENGACAPCYEYKSKRTGLMIMECPFLQFPPEHKD